MTPAGHKRMTTGSVVKRLTQRANDLHYYPEYLEHDIEHIFRPFETFSYLIMNFLDVFLVSLHM